MGTQQGWGHNRVGTPRCRAGDLGHHLSSLTRATQTFSPWKPHLESPFLAPHKAQGSLSTPTPHCRAGGGCKQPDGCSGGGLKTPAAPQHGGAGGDAGARRLQKLPGHVRRGRDEATTEAGVHETVYWRRTEALVIHDTPLSPPSLSPFPIPSHHLLPPPRGTGSVAPAPPPRDGGCGAATNQTAPPFHLKC